MKRGTSRYFGLATSVIAATLLIAAYGSARAGVLDQLKQFGATAGSAPAAAGTSVPNIAHSSAITPLNARGTGTLDFVHSGSGACPDAVLACSSDTCECDVFNGLVKVPKLGQASMVLNITSDDTAGFNNGTGECFPGTGHGTLCNSNSSKCMGIFVTGNICTGIVSEIDPNNATVAITANETFYIDPASSTGKFNGSSGGGNLQINDALTIVSSVFSSQMGYTTLSGAFQMHP